MELTNRRHEDFCRNYALVPNGHRAARMCGYSDRTARQQASRLLHRPDISARIAELRAETSRRNCLDADALFGKLEAVYSMCISFGRFAQAVRAVEAQARLAGYLTQQAARGEMKEMRENAARAKLEMLANVNSDPRDRAPLITVRGLDRVTEAKVSRVLGSA
jgi:hypothetical protein